MALGTFRFQTDITLARLCFASAGNDLSIDGQLNHTVAAGDAVKVPFACRPGPLFAGQTARPAGGMRTIGFEGRAVYGEDIAMAGVILRISAIEHLHLNGAREGRARGRDRIRPDKQSGVTA